MSRTLSKAIELARMLPEREQEALGSLLMEEMQCEGRWASLFAASQKQLGALADAAIAQHRAGKTRPWE